MKGRYNFKDDAGCEWMMIAQYVRAIASDFGVDVSAGLISQDCKNKFISPDHMGVKVGKRCINYTASVIKFFENHPQIAPNRSAILEWQKKLPPAIRAETQKSADKVVIQKRGRLLLNDDKEKAQDEADSDNSAALEKSKHERIKRKKAEFEFEIFKGNYIHIDDVTAVLSVIGIETRQSVKAIIPRVAEICAATQEAHAIRLLLDRETDVALSQLHRLDEILDGSFEATEAQRQKADEE